MKPTEPGAETSAGACMGCLRRSWLLAVTGARLDYRCREEGRLVELLALGDEELVRALGGTRKTELKARYEQFDPGEIPRAAGVSALCRHDRRFPGALNGVGAPRML